MTFTHTMSVRRALGVAGVLLGLGACAKVSPRPAGGGSGASGPTGSGGGSGGSGTGIAGTGAGGTYQPPPPPPPPLTDFPSDPVLGTATTPANAPALFAGATPRTGGAPCVASPQAGTLMPRNWLRPRFEWRRAADENLYEITLTVARFATPLRVYTTDTSYALDHALWDGLRLSVNDEPISVAVRALTLSSAGAVQTPPSAPGNSSFTIAPVDAPGKIVYWAVPKDANGQSQDGVLVGFGIGEEGVVPVLNGAQVQAPDARDPTRDSCIGCHAATPDGLSVGFQFGPPQSMIGLDTYYDTIANVGPGTPGAVPVQVTPAALATIRAMRGIPAYSRAHWSAGDSIVLLGDGQNHGELRWVQLDGTGQGLIARDGDARGAVEPTFSHDGNTIVYVSTPPGSIHDGRLSQGPADLYVVPYMNRAGGAAAALAGAADANAMEYYPSFAPDDTLVAYTSLAAPNGSTPDSYSNPGAELYVVPAAGGAALRLDANDPPACLNQHSPGLTNDWPKWSPDASQANGKTYYWLTFSSKRSGRPQLYVTAVVRGGELGGLQTFPALYLWNQLATQDNHTPSWDNYVIPPVQ